jgi:hypothetical protein
MKIALYDNERSSLAQVKDITWEELTELLSKPKTSTTKNGRAWSPVELSKPYRKNEYVKNHSLSTRPRQPYRGTTQ